MIDAEEHMPTCPCRFLQFSYLCGHDSIQGLVIWCDQLWSSTLQQGTVQSWMTEGVADRFPSPVGIRPGQRSAAACSRMPAIYQHLQSSTDRRRTREDRNSRISRNLRYRGVFDLLHHIRIPRQAGLLGAGLDSRICSAECWANTEVEAYWAGHRLSVSRVFRPRRGPCAPARRRPQASRVE